MKKKVLITGSSKGIGRAQIEEFAKNNFDVVINYNTGETKALELKELVETKYGISAQLVKADITNEKEVIEMFNKIDKIDVLINNAAICLDNEVFEKNEEEFTKVLKVNVWGTFLTSKIFIKKYNEGTIINIASTDGIDTYSKLSMDYCASKAAVISLTNNFSSNFPNLKICAVAPNWVSTESVKEMNKEYLEGELKRVGQKRLIKPITVAKIVYDVVINPKIKSGSIIRIDGD